VIRYSLKYKKRSGLYGDYGGLNNREIIEDLDLVLTIEEKASFLQQLSLKKEKNNVIKFTKNGEKRERYFMNVLKRALQERKVSNEKLILNIVKTRPELVAKQLIEIVNEDICECLDVEVYKELKEKIYALTFSESTANTILLEVYKHNWAKNKFVDDKRKRNKEIVWNIKNLIQIFEVNSEEKLYKKFRRNKFEIVTSVMDKRVRNYISILKNSGFNEAEIEKKLKHTLTEFESNCMDSELKKRNIYGSYETLEMFISKQFNVSKIEKKEVKEKNNFDIDIKDLKPRHNVMLAMLNKLGINTKKFEEAKKGSKRELFFEEVFNYNKDFSEREYCNLLNETELKRHYKKTICDKLTTFIESSESYNKKSLFNRIIRLGYDFDYAAKKVISAEVIANSLPNLDVTDLYYKKSNELTFNMNFITRDLFDENKFDENLKNMRIKRYVDLLNNNLEENKNLMSTFNISSLDLVSSSANIDNQMVKNSMLYFEQNGNKQCSKLLKVGSELSSNYNEYITKAEEAEAEGGAKTTKDYVYELFSDM